MIFSDLKKSALNIFISLLIVVLFSLSIDYIFSTFATFSSNKFDTYQKAAILFFALLSLSINGLYKNVNYNLFFAYTILLLNTIFLNNHIKNLSYYNIFSAYIGFLIGFIILKIRFEQSHILYKLITYLPLLSIIIKLTFSSSIFREEFGTYRLHTFLSPAHLAFLSFNVIFFQLVILMNKKIFKVPYLIIVNYIILTLTLSRTGILLSTIMLIYALYLISNKISLNKKQRFFAKFSLFLIPIPLIFSIFQILLRRTESFNDSKYNINTSGREEMWSYYLSKLNSDNIYWGNGLGSLKTIDTSDLSVLVTNSHNEYIRIIVENGILGFLIFFSFFFMHIKSIRYKLMPLNVSNLYSLFIFLILIYCVTDNYFTTISSWYLYCFIVNIITSKSFFLQLQDKRV